MGLVTIDNVWVFVGRVVSTSAFHQCGPGSIPGWGSDPGVVHEKGFVPVWATLRPWVGTLSSLTCLSRTLEELTRFLKRVGESLQCCDPSSAASSTFNVFGSISRMLIVKRIWTCDCQMEFVLYKLSIDHHQWTLGLQCLEMKMLTLLMHGWVTLTCGLTDWEYPWIQI